MRSMRLLLLRLYRIASRRHRFGQQCRHQHHRGRRPHYRLCHSQSTIKWCSNSHHHRHHHLMSVIIFIDLQILHHCHQTSMIRQCGDHGNKKQQKQSKAQTSQPISRIWLFCSGHQEPMCFEPNQYIQIKRERVRECVRAAIRWQLKLTIYRNI